MNKDDDRDFEAIVEDRENEHLEAALSRADADTQHYPDHWRGMPEP